MPHSHPGTEHITILSGEFYMGFTDKFDEGSAQKLGPGSFVLMPSGKHVHYAFTKGQKTVVQLHGVGPWDVKYVNPGEDPRRNK
jgi:quercetin dioxygenase-like cupin family protein